MPETPYQALRRLGGPLAELPTTLRPDGQSVGHIYVAKVAAGVRIGELHDRGETSFVIPDLHFDKIVEIIKSWRAPHPD